MSKTLYHGTPTRFDAFRTPTGLSAMDVIRGGVVYFLDTYEAAKRYAKGGFVVVCEVTDAVLYSEQRKRQGLQKKKGRYTAGVYVALAKNIKITEWRTV